MDEISPSPTISSGILAFGSGTKLKGYPVSAQDAVAAWPNKGVAICGKKRGICGFLRSGVSGVGHEMRTDSNGDENGSYACINRCIDERP